MKKFGFFVLAAFIMSISAPAFAEMTKDNEIVVPQNGGFWVIGNARSYSKSSVFAFKWNGSSLEETWHTRQDQDYLADFILDERLKELVILQVVKKEGVIDKGASAVVVKKIE